MVHAYSTVEALINDCTGGRLQELHKRSKCLMSVLMSDNHHMNTAKLYVQNFYY